MSIAVERLFRRVYVEAGDESDPSNSGRKARGSAEVRYQGVGESSDAGVFRGRSGLLNLSSSGEKSAGEPGVGGKVWNARFGEESRRSFPRYKYVSRRSKRNACSDNFCRPRASLLEAMGETVGVPSEGRAAKSRCAAAYSKAQSLVSVSERWGGGLLLADGCASLDSQALGR